MRPDSTIKARKREKIGVDQPRPQYTCIYPPGLQSQNVKDTSIRVQEPTHYNVENDYAEVAQNDQRNELKNEYVPQNASHISQENVSPSVETRMTEINSGKANQAPKDIEASMNNPQAFSKSKQGKFTTPRTKLPEKDLVMI